MIVYTYLHGSQEDTALHIAMKKSSTHVEEMIRSKGKENGESLDIKNKVCLPSHH